MKPNLAIAYAMGKKAKKMASGGMMKCAHGGGADCPKCYAEGGPVGKESRSEYDPYKGKGVHPGGSRDYPGESIAGDFAREGKMDSAKSMHKDRLKELRASRHKDRKYLAEGGEVDDDDMIGRIMRKREGEPVADFEQNDFDYMDEEPVPDEADYTGENSGDELGNETHDEEDRDMVSRIMRSRAKKDRLPRPA